MPASCPRQFQLVGVDLAAKSTDDWRQGLTDMMNEFVTKGGGEFQADHIDQDAWRWLTEPHELCPGRPQRPRDVPASGPASGGTGQVGGTAGNYLFYLAVADRFFEVVVAGLGAAGLTTEPEGQWRRVVIEKPFGHDLASAKALNAEILKSLHEPQIYRIDHFLGKETVQNIMALRFANGLFEPIWNREHIDHIQITAAETVGVEHRGKFYEKTGALRDMVPNHLFQLMSMTAMEPPISFDAEAVRAKKAEVIEAIQPLTPERALRDAVRGQYAAGTVMGQPVRAYRQEPDVAAEFDGRNLHRLQADDRQLALGRRAVLSAHRQILKRRRTEIAIRFHQAPYALFRGTDVAATASQLADPAHLSPTRASRSRSPPSAPARPCG